MSIAMQFALIPIVVLGVLASVADIRTRRIPNVLTFGAAAVAVLFHLVVGGSAGAAWSLGGWAVGCALFLPFFLLGGMGAGDVKLLAAFGAWLGPYYAFWAWAFAALAGGVLAIAVALMRGYLLRAVRNVWSLLCYWRVCGVRPLEEITLESATAPRIAYALPITIGSLVAWFVK